MSTIIFDGRKYADDNEAKLAAKVTKLPRVPKLVSVVVGDEQGALAYQHLKQKAAGRVGCEVEILQLSETSPAEEVITAITKANSDKAVDGVMVQLPLPSEIKKDQTKIIDTISPEKDVDGMRADSPCVAPVVRAVEAALSAAKVVNTHTLAVLGASGFVGQKLMARLRALGFSPKGFDMGSDLLELNRFHVVVSATGRPGLVQPEMVKDGAVLVDLGAPQGDIAKETLVKASFTTPVPGGIGPVTIYYLIENLVQIANS